MKAIRVHETGGPDKLSYEDVPVPAPGPGQVRIKVHAIGLNFHDKFFLVRPAAQQVPFGLPLLRYVRFAEGDDWQRGLT